MGLLTRYFSSAPGVGIVVQVAATGWQQLPDRAPALAELIANIHHDPQLLGDALAGTPATFIAGDWKLGNLGRHPDGRTILLDWAYPGEAPGAWDLAWYLAINAARLPISKDDTIALYRDALERCNVDVSGWFDRQVSLSLLGMAAAAPV